MQIESRQFQLDDVEYAMSRQSRGIRPIHCSPTGSGKTVIQALIAKAELDLGNPTAILTPRVEIFDQTESLAAHICGPHNIAMLRSGRDWRRDLPVNIVSWPTLIKRAARSRAWLPDVKRVLVDEAHLSMAPRILDLLEHYVPRALIDGYTATPGRLTGKGLGRYYTEIHHVTTVRRLIAEGYLVPGEYWAGSLPDLKGVRTRQGDFEKKELEKRCMVLVGDVIDNWLRLARDRQTIVFAVDTMHAEALNARFLEAGIRSVCIHYRLAAEQRAEKVEAFKRGEYQVLVNVTIASYGFDAPAINCVVCARPTKSLVLWLQMLGRAMRPMAGKQEFMVLDHADNTRRLGQAEDLYRWRLDPGKQAVENWSRHDDSGQKEQSQTHECEQCHYLFSGSRVCPKCGWELPYRKRDIDTLDADLVRISGAIAKELPAGWPSHEMFFRMLKHHAQKKGYHKWRGWAAQKFKKLAEVWPDNNWDHLAGVPPNARAANWIRKEAQNYARRKAYGRRSRAKPGAVGNATGGRDGGAAGLRGGD